MSTFFALRNISEVILLVLRVGLNNSIIAQIDNTCPKIITSFRLSKVPVNIATDPAYAYPNDIPRGNEACSDISRLPSLTVYVVSDQTANITVNAIRRPSSMIVEISEGLIAVRRYMLKACHVMNSCATIIHLNENAAIPFSFPEASLSLLVSQSVIACRITLTMMKAIPPSKRILKRHLLCLADYLAKPQYYQGENLDNYNL